MLRALAQQEESEPVAPPAAALERLDALAGGAADALAKDQTAARALPALANALTGELGSGAPRVESGGSYKRDYKGYEPAPSTASQTAWALLGLMAAGEPDNPAVAGGIAYLASTQGEDGFWSEPFHTATGFPRVFYLRYHGYSKFFPLWALARYRNLKRGNSRGAIFGM